MGSTEPSKQPNKQPNEREQADEDRHDVGMGAKHFGSSPTPSYSGGKHQCAGRCGGCLVSAVLTLCALLLHVAPRSTNCTVSPNYSILWQFRIMSFKRFRPFILCVRLEFKMFVVCSHLSSLSDRCLWSFFWRQAEESTLQPPQEARLEKCLQEALLQKVLVAPSYQNYAK